MTGGFTWPVEVYDLISRLCERRGTDVVALRPPVGPPVLCLRGAEAARLFYDDDRFERTGVLPRRARATLVGDGGVQTLDGDAHRHRKALFMGLMTPASVAELDRLVADAWSQAVDRWCGAGPVVLYEEVGRLLCAAVCAWAGIPLPEEEVPARTGDLHALIESPLAVGPPHWRGRRARRRAERWAAALVEAVRREELRPPAASALRAVAEHRDADGELLDPHTAAVELLNVVRPTVAVDRYVVFVACALVEHQGWADRLRRAGDGDPVVDRFVQEVRRHYPFFPFQAARVRRPFVWRGTEFPAGGLAVLDFHGTNHHPALWPDPGRFDPDRFAGGGADPFALVPQGGGDPHTGHRCAGEAVTLALMATATRTLTQVMTYDVPPQDLRLSRRKVPALPNSGFVITNVRRAGGG